jgi:hypothetical protein
MKMLCLEISIHHQGPGVQPGRSWQGILFFGIGIGIGIGTEAVAVIFLLLLFKRRGWF